MCEAITKPCDIPARETIDVFSQEPMGIPKKLHALRYHIIYTLLQSSLFGCPRQRRGWYFSCIETVSFVFKGLRMLTETETVKTS